MAISTFIGDESILKNTKQVTEKYNDKASISKSTIDSAYDELDKYFDLKTYPQITELTETQEKTVVAEDAKGNKVSVPGGFKVRTDIATTVQNGIVIEDEIGNQFVWIPIGDVIKDDGSTVKIELGRYYNEVIQQSADDYEDIVEIQYGWFEYMKMYELSTFRESNFNYYSPALGSTSYNLGEFISKTKENKGYYIARYAGKLADETGITSDYTDGVAAVTDEVPTFMGDSVTTGIRQGDAAIACRNLYAGNEFVVSDLLNSYASDTAGRYISLCEVDYNECNIVTENREWTTESVSSNGTEAYSVYISYSLGAKTQATNASCSGDGAFRAVLYVK